MLGGREAEAAIRHEEATATVPPGVVLQHHEGTRPTHTAEAGTAMDVPTIAVGEVEVV